MFLPWYYFIGVVSWPVMRLVWRLRADGLASLPPGGFVLASNHVSNFDPWPLGFPLWPRRRLRWMAKVELFRFPFDQMLLKGGAFPVSRGRSDQRAIQTAIRVVREGDVLVMFPEGTRREKGLRKKFEARPHTGAARIAIAARAPLVPAAIVGTDRLSKLPQLRVAYGRPIPMDDLHGLSHKRAAEVATERLMQEIRRLEEHLAARA